MNIHDSLTIRLISRVEPTETVNVAKWVRNDLVYSHLLRLNMGDPKPVVFITLGSCPYDYALAVTGEGNACWVLDLKTRFQMTVGRVEYVDCITIGPNERSQSPIGTDGET